MENNNLIKYFHDCYRADNREGLIWNFFSQKVEAREFIDGKEELANGFLPHLPLADARAGDLQKKLSIYQKEKELFYCSFFLLGHGESSIAGENRICSPLFYYPAEIVEDAGFHYLRIDFEKRRFNHGLLSVLNVKPGLEQGVIEQFYSELQEGPVEFRETGIISRLFQNNFTDVETSELSMYPDLMNEKRIRKLVLSLKNKETFTIVPASCTCIIKKSSETIGVLNELSELAESKGFSAPITSILSGPPQARKQSFYRGLSPGILSNPQEKVIKSASVNGLTFVVGPPGTGKSYTLAALAIEHMSKGKSVLIASKNDTAVDVIGDKIEEQLQLRNVVSRAGRKDYKNEIKNRLSDFIKGIGSFGFSNTEIKEKEFELKRLAANIDILESEFEKRVEKELNWGSYLKKTKGSLSFTSGIYRKYIHWRNNKLKPHWKIISEMEEAMGQKAALTSELINLRFNRQLFFARKNHKMELQRFLNAIRSRTGSKREELFNSTNFKALLGTFPIWLVKLSDIYDVLPLKKELFDLVIIDEATQCDIASCLPVLQRGRHAVIAGDPKQLRHISFLSRERQNLIAIQHQISEPDNFSYRDKSMIDFMECGHVDISQVVYLDEHYRSAAGIINFSNHEFYSGSLKLMKEVPVKEPNQSLFHINSSGKRGKEGSNEKEAEKLTENLVELVNSQKGLDQQAAHSIGILSPFRNQADLVFSMVNKALDLSDITKHKLMIGTAHSFQGEERDSMFLSFALDDASHLSAFRFLQRSDVFNVSITRARSQQFVFTSFDHNRLPQDSLLRKYISQIGKDVHSLKKPQSGYDHFCREVKEALVNNGFHTWVSQPVAGLSIDLLFNCGKRTYAIDLIGYPGDFKNAFPLERYRMLRRAGLTTFPLPYTYWVADKEHCFGELMEWVKGH